MKNTSAFSLLAATLAWVFSAGAAIPGKLPVVTVEGTLEVIIADDFEQHRSETFYSVVENRSGKKFSLTFPDQPPAGALTGMRVRVQGRVQGAELALTPDVAKAAGSGSPAFEVLESPPVAAFDTRNTLVILLNFTDENVACVRSRVDSLMFSTTSDSVKGFYEECSYGAITFSGAAVGPYDVSLSTGSPGSRDEQSAKGDAAARAHGYEPNDYDHVVYVLPSGSGGSAGLAEVGGKHVWLRYCSTMIVYAHELGHNLGMLHSSNDTDDNGSVDDEYGDYSCVMGNDNLAHPNVMWKRKKGWVPASKEKLVTATDTFLLAPLEDVPSETPYLQCLRLNISGSSQDYYVSYRVRRGYDNCFSSTEAPRVYFHRWNGSDNTLLVAKAGEGGTFNRQSTSGFTVNVINADSSAATLQIVIPGSMNYWITGNGNWNASSESSKWSLGHRPDANEHAWIGNNALVTRARTAAETYYGLRIGYGSSDASSYPGSGTLLVSDGQTETITGNLTLGGQNGASGTLNMTSGRIEVGGTFIIGAGNGTLDLSGGVLDLNNHDTTLNGNLTITGTSSWNPGTGSISATSARTLTWNNSGTLTLSGSGDNAYLVAVVSGGTVVLNKTSSGSVHALGGGTHTVNNGARLKLSGSGGDQIYDGNAVTISSGGVFDLNGQSEQITTLNLAGTGMSSGGALINDSGTTTPTLTCSSGIALTANASLGGSASIVLPSAIRGAYSLTKVGAGTLSLSGTNSYSGGTTVSGGTLELAGSLASSVNLFSGVFKGGGTVNANVTISGGTHAPGASAGVLTVKGNYALNAGGTLRIEINGLTPGTQYDQVKLISASSTVTLAGALQVSAAAGLPLGASFVIITNAGAAAVNGTFAGLSQGAAFSSGGQWFQINYTGGNGNDVVLTTVSPPNNPPTISEVPDQAMPQDTVVGPLPFTVGDTETPAALLTVTAQSSNPTVLPVADITFSGSGSNRFVTLRPATNQTGYVTVTLVVSDGSLAASNSFVVNVGFVNDPPSSCVLTSPTNGQTLLLPPTFTATASDPDNNLVRVSFYADGAKAGDDTNAPYSFTWSNATAGAHSLFAVAIDAGGLRLTSAVANVMFLLSNTLVPTGAVWRYLDDGSDQGTAWRGAAFDDVAWKFGPAQLGYGDGDEATVVGYGPDPTNKYITTWFRRSFILADASIINTLDASLLRDDGAVVYLNGTEVWRSNLPTNGAINHTTLASAAISGSGESAWLTTNLNPALLVDGPNVLAVEIHQSDGDSTDLSFDFALTATSLGLLANQPPDVQVTRPADGQFYAAPATVTLSAFAKDPDGTVAQVDFYLGNTFVGGQLSEPYSLTLSNLPIGDYILSAVATDDDGAAAMSLNTVTLRVLPTTTATLIATGAVWKYRDNGANLGTAWRVPGYDDASWHSGPAQLGYGDDDEATVVGYGPNSTNKYLTTYFRRGFVLFNTNPGLSLNARLLRDDGAVVYLNGVEVWRSNMPTNGTITYLTQAVTNVGGLDETTHFHTNLLDPALLLPGTNLIAVEVHQNTNTSTDLSFDFELTATQLLPQPPALTATPSAGSAILFWPADAGFFTLYFATNLTPPVWLPTTNEPVFSNGLWLVPLSPAGSGQRFYRLQSP